MGSQKDDNEVVVNAKILAKVLGVGVRQITNLHQQGICVKNASGRFLLIPSVQNYIKRLRVELAAGKSSNGSENVSDDTEVEDIGTEKAKHEHVKRQITELKLQLMRGQVYEEEKVKMVMSDILTNFKQKLLTVPSKLSTKVEKKDAGEINQILTDEINEILLELCEYNPEDFVSDVYIEEDADGQNS